MTLILRSIEHDLNKIRPFVPQLLQEVSRGVQSETRHAW